MYQVIARKWRPQTFEEVTGQEHITRTLSNAVEHDRLHHAYIFSGARGVGKTSTARLFAKALNCHKSDKPTPEFCRTDDPDACHSCREIAEGRSIDVQEIDAASTTGVQNVRDSIIDTIGIAPARDRFKVFIIDEVHMLSAQAFNALLKTLEEPPPRVVFVMATTEGHKLLDTIVSRCQKFEFRTIAAARIAERLRVIAVAEQIKITDEALREIARAGEGSMRDAQSALDQIISFSGNEIKAEDVESALGIAGVDILGRVMTALAESNSATVLAVVDDLVMRGHDLRNFCRDLMAYLRDLLVAKATDGADDVLELTESERGELANQATSFSEADLVRFFHSLTETENTLRDAAHPRYQLEVGLIKLIEMRRLAPINQIIERLNTLEASIRTGRPPLVNPTPSPVAGGGGSKKRARDATQHRAKSASELSAVVEASVMSSTVADRSSPESNLGSLPSITQTAAKSNESPEPSIEDSSVSTKSAESVVMDVVASDSIMGSIRAALEKRRRMFLVTALEAARRVDIEDDEMTVEFTSDAKHLRDNLATADNIKLLREICREIVGREVSVRISVRDREVDKNEGPISRDEEERLDKQRMRDAALKNPAVQQVLQTFHAEIVDIRRVSQDSKSASQKAE